MKRAVALLLALALAPATARADVTGWFAVGGGALAWKQPGADEGAVTFSQLLAFDAGVGMQDTSPFVVGGLLRVQPLLGEGTDLAAMARFATESFNAGPLGFALDAGGYARFWEVGSAGFIGQAVLGGPLGLELAFLGMVGSGEAWGLGGVLSLDFARMTTHRRHLLDWWPSPRPTDAMEPAQALAW